MAFYLIGLGLNEKALTLEAVDVLKKCKKIYLDFYTVDFPYDIEELEKVVGKKLKIAEREFVEQKMQEIVKIAKKQNVALLVYGSPLFATTHLSLLETCREKKIKYKVIYSASVFDAVAEIGLHLYNFGKITSLPKWDEKKNFKPDSFVNVIKENLKINAHSLILVDIGLSFEDALEELLIATKEKQVKLNKIIICSQLSTDKSNTYYRDIKDDKINKLNVKAPFCFVIPAEKLNFKEKEALERLE